MNEPNRKPHPENQPPLTPQDIALEMLNQLTRQNSLLEAKIKLDEQQLELIDELNGRLETVTRACQIVADMKEEGKIKIGFAEFAQAMAEADEEIMGEDEEGEGDIPARH